MDKQILFDEALEAICYINVYGNPYGVLPLDELEINEERFFEFLEIIPFLKQKRPIFRIKDRIKQEVTNV